MADLPNPENGGKHRHEGASRGEPSTSTWRRILGVTPLVLSALAGLLTNIASEGLLRSSVFLFVALVAGWLITAITYYFLRHR
jgi:hypothetical protein